MSNNILKYLMDSSEQKAKGKRQRSPLTNFDDVALRLWHYYHSFLAPSHKPSLIPSSRSLSTLACPSPSSNPQPPTRATHCANPSAIHPELRQSARPDSYGWLQAVKTFPLSDQPSLGSLSSLIRTDLDQDARYEDADGDSVFSDSS